MAGNEPKKFFFLFLILVCFVFQRKKGQGGRTTGQKGKGKCINYFHWSGGFTVHSLCSVDPPSQNVLTPPSPSKKKGIMRH